MRVTILVTCHCEACEPAFPKTVCFCSRLILTQSQTDRRTAATTLLDSLSALFCLPVLQHYPYSCILLIAVPPAEKRDCLQGLGAGAIAMMRCFFLSLLNTKERKRNLCLNLLWRYGIGLFIWQGSPYMDLNTAGLFRSASAGNDKIFGLNSASPD